MATATFSILVAVAVAAYVQVNDHEGTPTFDDAP
jgi:hypothetical protein